MITNKCRTGWDRVRPAQPRFRVRIVQVCSGSGPEAVPEVEQTASGSKAAFHKCVQGRLFSGLSAQQICLAVLFVLVLLQVHV